MNRKSVLIAQQMMYHAKTDRQVRYMFKSNEKEKTFCQQREYPLQVGVGLLALQQMRSKSMIDVLHELGVSVDYMRILHIETQLVQAVLSNYSEHSIFIPPQLSRGQFTFSVLTTPTSQNIPQTERTHFMQRQWSCSSENLVMSMKLYWTLMGLLRPSPFHKRQYRNRNIPVS